MYERINLLIGCDNVDKIKKSTVLVVGLGGVGGYAVEALVRSGVGNLIIVDYDTIDISNLNRQIITNTNNIGKLKTEEMRKRIISINPEARVDVVNVKLDSDNLEEIFKYKFDALIDCCDTIVVKEGLIRECLARGITFISSMGAGNKLNPSMLEVADLRDTSYDPIAKKLRKFVNDNKIYGHIPVVYSREVNDKFTGSIPSMIFVPATSGLMCANYVVNEIIKDS